MNELKQVLEKVNTKTLWLLMYKIAKCFSEVEPEQADNEVLFWYALFKVVEQETDKRITQED